VVFIQQMSNRQQRRREKKGKRREQQKLKKQEAKILEDQRLREQKIAEQKAIEEKKRQEEQKELRSRIRLFKRVEARTRKIGYTKKQLRRKVNRIVTRIRQKRSRAFIFSLRNKHCRLLDFVPRIRSKITRLDQRWSWVLLGRWVQRNVTRVEFNFKTYTKNSSRRAGIYRDVKFPIRFFGKHYRSRFRQPDIFRARRLRLFSPPRTTFLDSKLSAEDDRLRRKPKQQKQKGKIRRDGVTHYKGMLIQSTDDLNNLHFSDRATRLSRATAYQQIQPRWSFALTRQGVRNHELRLRWVQPKSFIPTVSICFVPTSRNFWGILHYKNKLVFQKTAGQLEQKGGPRRWKDKPQHEVIKLLSSKLQLLFEDFQRHSLTNSLRVSQRMQRLTRRRRHYLAKRKRLAPARRRREQRRRQLLQKLMAAKGQTKALKRKLFFSPVLRKTLSDPTVINARKAAKKHANWQKRTKGRYLKILKRRQKAKKSHYVSKFRIKIKLKNYVPHRKRWWVKVFRRLFRFLPRNDHSFKASVLLETVISRPHNGLRARKQIRQ
jgi:hypothetical protein